MVNPFAATEIATGDAFCNRVTEQEELLAYMKNGQNVLLYGPRRTGKTSLLKRVIAVNDLAKHTLYVDLYGSLSEKDFVSRLYSAIAAKQGSLKKALKLFAGLRLTTEVDPVTAAPSFSVALDPAQAPAYLASALSMLQKMSVKAPLVVVFDEFQEVALYGEEGFEKRLRSAIQTHEGISYLFCGSRKHLLLSMFAESSRAFYHLARHYPLPEISEQAYISWACGLFERKNVALDPGLVAQIVARYEGSPLYIQQTLWELWQRRKIDAATLREIDERILARRQPEMMALWDRLTLNQKKTLRILAEKGTSQLSSAATLARVGLKSSSQLHRALSTLFEADLLDKNEKGRYVFQDVLFKHWVRRTVG